MKITLAQLNPMVGDVRGNLQKVVDTLEQEQRTSDLIVFSELFLVGYPPRDLLEKPALIDQVQEALERLVALSARYPETGMLVGAPQPTGRDTGKGLCNCAVLIHQGEVLLRQTKSLLPTYDVFDETRHFDPAVQVEVVPFKDEILGISICEDAWYDPELWCRRLYPLDPIQVLAQKGATVLINISASPFQVGKEELRHRLFQAHARSYGLPLVYVNQVGGNDELIFDGRSLALDRRGRPSRCCRAFGKRWSRWTWRNPAPRACTGPRSRSPRCTRPWSWACGTTWASAVSSKPWWGSPAGWIRRSPAAWRPQALGRENVLGVLMPSPYTSRDSIVDSLNLARNLGVETRLIPITPIYQCYREALQGPLQLGEIERHPGKHPGPHPGQHPHGHLQQVRPHGPVHRQQERAGGGLLHPVRRHERRARASWRTCPRPWSTNWPHYLNRDREMIPGQIIRKAPSAELRPDQKDQDTLPPYDILDRIMNCYLTEGYAYEDIVTLGFDPETVQWVIRTIDRNEYKRRQAAPGLKITSKAFGMGRRIPIAAQFEL